MVEAALGQLWDDLAELEGASDSDEIADGLERMNAAYPEVKEFLDAVDEINTMVAKQIAPPLKQIDAAGAAVPKEVTDLLAVSASDPLSLTADEIERRIAEIAELAAFKPIGPRPSPKRPRVWTHCVTRYSTRRRRANAPPRRC